MSRKVLGERAGERVELGSYPIGGATFNLRQFRPPRQRCQWTSAADRQDNIFFPNGFRFAVRSQNLRVRPSLHVLGRHIIRLLRAT